MPMSVLIGNDLLFFSAREKETDRNYISHRLHNKKYGSTQTFSLSSE